MGLKKCETTTLFLVIAGLIVIALTLVVFTRVGDVMISALNDITLRLPAKVLEFLSGKVGQIPETLKG
jgi:hypothetical protein